MITCLVDTNVLLRLVDLNSPDHSLARDAVLRLDRNGDSLVVIPQCIVEFRCVATRPATSRGGLGYPSARADLEIAELMALFPQLADVPEVFQNWLTLVSSLEICGVEVYDARLVAAMQAHSIRHVLTFDTSDFARFRGITARHPADVMAVSEDEITETEQP